VLFYSCRLSVPPTCPTPAPPSTSSAPAPSSTVAAESSAVASLNKQIEAFNADRMPDMGITPISQRVSRVKYNPERDEVTSFDESGQVFVILCRDTDRRFLGTVETPFHQLAFSGPGGEHMWGHVLAKFYLEKDAF
jgi:hypothetical protein